MSNDWKKQLAELSKNEEFQKKQKEIAEKFKDNEAAMKEESIKLLAEYGITEPEGGFKAPVKELSDDELGAVAGGIYRSECVCPLVGVGTAGSATCVCPAAGGGTNNSEQCTDAGGCGCFLGGYGEIYGD